MVQMQNLNCGTEWLSMIFLLNDHLNVTDYVHTDAGCIGGNSLADYFAQALSSFPSSSATYYQACTVQFTNHPNQGLEPNWNNQIDTSSNLGLNASGIAIAKTDAGGDTSGIVGFYEADDTMEADVGLGALENGTTYTDTRSISRCWRSNQLRLFGCHLCHRLSRDGVLLG